MARPREFDIDEALAKAGADRFAPSPTPRFPLNHLSPFTPTDDGYSGGSATLAATVRIAEVFVV